MFVVFFLRDRRPPRFTRTDTLFPYATLFRSIGQRGPQLASETRLPGVLEWAREHLSEPLSVDVLAEVAHMSRRTFTRRFREATGTTVTQWLNAQRVARAQQLLETTDMPIEAVAGEAGFGTPLGMRQQFGAQLGNTPSP